jgi:1-phosphofructokinase family hexose kinase
MPGNSGPRGRYLTVCLNPVIQKSLVFGGLAKGEVNRTAEHRVDVAGKGICCSRVLGQIGREAVHLTQLGGPTRDWFLAMCAADAVAVRWVESLSPIRFCTTIVDTVDRSATELVEEGARVDEGTAGRILEEFDRMLPDVTTVMLAGTKAPGFPAQTMSEMARRTRAAGKRLFLDLKGDDLRACLPFGPLVVKPNLDEFLLTFPPEPAANDAEEAIRAHLARAGRGMKDRHGSWLVVTRGTRPTLFWDGDALRECPVHAVAALNPTGSGDAFGAGVAAALEDGATIAEAVAEGTRLGALNAKTLGPGSIR